MEVPQHYSSTVKIITRSLRWNSMYNFRKNAAHNSSTFHNDQKSQTNTDAFQPISTIRITEGDRLLLSELKLL